MLGEIYLYHLSEISPQSFITPERSSTAQAYTIHHWHSCHHAAQRFAMMWQVLARAQGTPGRTAVWGLTVPHPARHSVAQQRITFVLPIDSHSGKADSCFAPTNYRDLWGRNTARSRGLASSEAKSINRHERATPRSRHYRIRQEPRQRGNQHTALPASHMSQPRAD